MSKKIINFFLVSILAIGILTVLNTPVLADGYDPYRPHIPEPTGFVDSMMFNIFAVATYTAGIASIGISKFLNSRVG
jgi:hypothetical protein